ncbi:MAG: hypothetical protein JOY77_00110 [Alphaproteobacteria bacterium]|nr:hypothetical protein [Alphaproteobacteria bacterium]MBV9061320.1 hypothetical protein [Alphaproteobacteria bacterium]
MGTLALHRSILAASFALMPAMAQAQSVEPLKNPPPDGVATTFQLTNGNVLAQGYHAYDWWLLIPDNTGSYVNGSWKRAADMPITYAPAAVASAVLADGRVLIEGGEYSNGIQVSDQGFTLTNKGAVYDPVADSWAGVNPPRGWDNIGDSPSVVLPDGRFLLGDKLHKRLALLDPNTMTWSAVPATGKNDFNSEEGWTLMPDGEVLAIDVKDHPQSELFDLKTLKWKNLGSTVADLQEPPIGGCFRYPPKNKCYYPPGEIGPAMLMPDGTVFAAGGRHAGMAHTAVYTPGKGWASGPDFPGGDAAGDSFASLLPNGHALIEANSGRLYEWDGKDLTAEPVTVGEFSSLMVLPTGGILVAGTEVYRSSGSWSPAWQPAITKCAGVVSRGGTYKISGKQFNGFSQANAFGDEYEQATNYPLVRITNNGTKHVFFARTHDHSTMGVATADRIVSTRFDVDPATETGASALVVIANGIPSDPVAITVQ